MSKVGIFKFVGAIFMPQIGSLFFFLNIYSFKLDYLVVFNNFNGGVFGMISYIYIFLV